MDTPPIRSRLLLGLAVTATLLASTTPRPAVADVLPWGGNGVWAIASTLDCLGPPNFFGIQGSLDLQQLGPALVAGTWSGGGTLEGTLRGREGYTLKGRFDHPQCGEGKVTLKLGGDFRNVEGTLKFPGAKGVVSGLYLRDAADSYDVGLRLAFAAAKKGVIKTGKSAVLTVFLENRGPQPIPIDTLLLRLRFSGAVGFQKVAVLKRLADIDFGVDLDPDAPQAELALPVAAGELLILAVKFRPPIDLAGTTLRVDADFVADPAAGDLGEPAPFVPPAAAFAEIDVEGLSVKLKLVNKDTQNIHIFLADDPDPFSERTRIAPGRSKTIKLTGRQFGEEIDLGAGRLGTTLDTCQTGALQRSGKGTVVWDPINFPSFLALRCPGGV
jgi:hypothetical protein